MACRGNGGSARNADSIRWLTRRPPKAYQGVTALTVTRILQCHRRRPEHCSVLMSSKWDGVYYCYSASGIPEAHASRHYQLARELRQRPGLTCRKAVSLMP